MRLGQTVAHICMSYGKGPGLSADDRDVPAKVCSWSEDHCPLLALSGGRNHLTERYGLPSDRRYPMPATGEDLAADASPAHRMLLDCEATLLGAAELAPPRSRPHATAPGRCPPLRHGARGAVTLNAEYSLWPASARKKMS